MMWFIKFIQKRPSDNTIRIARIIFWIILSGALYYNLIIQWDAIDSNMFWVDFTEFQLTYFKYWFSALWLIPIFMWISNICLVKKKYMRFIQWFFALVLFYISSTIVEWASLDVDSLIAVMWIFPLFAWITWKCITSNCMKYAEKITKIRV